MIGHDTVIMFGTNIGVGGASQRLVNLIECIGADRVGKLAALVAVEREFSQHMVQDIHQVFCFLLGKGESRDTVDSGGHVAGNEKIGRHIVVFSVTCCEVQLVESRDHVGVVELPQVVAAALVGMGVLPHLIGVRAPSTPNATIENRPIMPHEAIDFGPDVFELVSSESNCKFFHE